MNQSCVQRKANTVSLKMFLSSVYSVFMLDAPFVLILGPQYRCIKKSHKQ